MFEPRCVVHIDVERMRQNVAEQGDELTPDELLVWLNGAGFRRQPDGLWITQALCLDMLERGEYQVVSRL